jgi:hypothetical protein
MSVIHSSLDDSLSVDLSSHWLAAEAVLQIHLEDTFFGDRG